MFLKKYPKKEKKRETDECINIFQEEEKGFGFFSFRLAAAERATRKSSELDSYIAMTTGSTYTQRERDAYIFFPFFSSRWTSRNDERASLLDFTLGCLWPSKEFGCASYFGLIYFITAYTQHKHSFTCIIYKKDGRRRKKGGFV